MAYELCSPKLIDAVVAEVFDGPLIEAGFHKIRDRFYVRSRLHEMCRIIHIEGEDVRQKMRSGAPR